MQSRDEISFTKLFKKYMSPNGKKRPLFSIWEYIVSIITGGLVGWLIIYTNRPEQFILSIGNLLFGASATILGIVIAGFAVFAAVSDEKFSVFLFENDAWLGISFPFWPAAIMWGIELLLSGIMVMLSYLILPLWVYGIVSSINAVWFTLALEFTISLFGIILRTTYYRSLYYSKTSKIVNMEVGNNESSDK